MHLNPSKHPGINELFDVMTENWGIDPQPLPLPAEEAGEGHGGDEEPGDDDADDIMMILDDDYEDPGECTDALAAGENAGMGDESFDEELQRFTEALAEAPEECVEAENEAALAAPCRGRGAGSRAPNPLEEDSSVEVSW